MAIKVHPSLAVHPGPWLRRNFVEPTSITVSKLAMALDVTRPAVSALLNGRANLSANMALRFEKAFGVSADTLMRMQTAYDLKSAREHAGDLRVERVLSPA